MEDSQPRNHRGRRRSRDADPGSDEEQQRRQRRRRRSPDAGPGRDEDRPAVSDVSSRELMRLAVRDTSSAPRKLARSAGGFGGDAPPIANAPANTSHVSLMFPEIAPSGISLGSSVMMPPGMSMGSSVMLPPGFSIPQMPGSAPQGQKSKMCDAFFRDGVCPEGPTCQLAHSFTDFSGDVLAPQDGPTTMKKLCIFWQGGKCKHGDGCWYAHGPDEMAKGYRERDQRSYIAPAPMRMDFGGLDRSDGVARPGQVTKTIKVPEDQVHSLMTDSTKDILMEVAGPWEVTWDPKAGKATIVGTAQQVEKAALALQRVTTHCLWGVSAAKIDHLLRPRTDYSSARLTLSPMVPSLKAFSATLSPSMPQITIGTDPANNLVVKGQMVSRQHAAIEFTAAKGAVYVVDMSTNGTFVNSRRLPPKGSAKVVLWHGDELLLQDPAGGFSEFGYVVNLEYSTSGSFSALC